MSCADGKVVEDVTLRTAHATRPHSDVGEHRALSQARSTASGQYSHKVSRPHSAQPVLGSGVHPALRIKNTGSTGRAQPRIKTADLSISPYPWHQASLSLPRPSPAIAALAGPCARAWPAWPGCPPSRHLPRTFAHGTPRSRDKGGARPRPSIPKQTVFIFGVRPPFHLPTRACGSGWILGSHQPLHALAPPPPCQNATRLHTYAHPAH